MSEIEKLYENACIKFIIGVHCRAKIGDGCKSRCPDCDYNTKPKEYPPFTAEKQLSLIKWLLQNKRLCVRKAEYSNNFYMDTIVNRSNGVDSKSFEVCLASLINQLWQDLTEEEQEQIRSILNG